MPSIFSLLSTLSWGRDFWLHSLLSALVLSTAVPYSVSALPLLLSFSFQVTTQISHLPSWWSSFWANQGSYLSWQYWYSWRLPSLSQQLDWYHHTHRKSPVCYYSSTGTVSLHVMAYPCTDSYVAVILLAASFEGPLPLLEGCPHWSSYLCSNGL